MSPEAYNAEILQTLKSINDKVSRIEGMLMALSAGGNAGGGRAGAPSSAGQQRGGGVASDSDLDGKYGDPKIRKDPRDWDGESYVGFSFSDAPPDYLDMLAGFLDWKAGKEAAEGKEKYAGYSRTDAARARGWAQRKRNGWRQSGSPIGERGAPSDNGFEAPPEDDIPF